MFTVGGIADDDREIVPKFGGTNREGSFTVASKGIPTIDSFSFFVSQMLPELQISSRVFFSRPGLLYGAAIGDALGLSTAQMSADECCFHYDEGALSYQDIIIDKYRLQWEKGDWTTAFDQMVSC